LTRPLDACAPAPSPPRPATQSAPPAHDEGRGGSSIVGAHVESSRQTQTARAHTPAHAYRGAPQSPRILEGTRVGAHTPSSLGHIGAQPAPRLCLRARAQPIRRVASMQPSRLAVFAFFQNRPGRPRNHMIRCTHDTQACEGSHDAATTIAQNQPASVYPCAHMTRATHARPSMRTWRTSTRTRRHHSDTGNACSPIHARMPRRLRRHHSHTTTHARPSTRTWHHARMPRRLHAVITRTQ
jgi:hypothetical protein